MPSIQEIRQQYPQYDDMSDADLAKALHGKYYSDMPFEEFSAKVGVEEQPATTLGNLKQFGVGLGKGAIALAGLPGDVNALAKKGAGWVAGKMGASPQTVEAMQNTPIPLPIPGFSSPITSAQIRGQVENVTGPFREAQNTAEGYSDRLGQFVPGMAIPGGSLVSKGMGTVLGAFGSEGAKQAGYGPWAELLGGVAGGLTGAFGWQAVFNAFKMRGADTKAAVQLAKELQASGMTPDEALAKVQGMGDEAMLADVSPRMQVATGGTAISDPAAQQTIASRLGARREAAPERVSRTLDDTFGPMKDPQQLTDEITTARQPAGPAYELAQQHVVDTEPAVKAVADGIMRYGAKSKIGSTLVSIRNQMLDDKGNLVSNGAQVHGIREQLDDMIGEAVRAGRGKEAQALGQIRDKIDDSLKTQIPGFADADKLWSGTAKIKEAYEFGRGELLTGKVSPGQAQKTLSGMPIPEREAVNQGTRLELDRVARNATAAPGNRLDRTMSRDWNSEKIAHQVGPQKTADLAQRLDTEGTFLETSALGEPTRGSRTAILDSARDMWGTGGSQPGLTGDTLAAFGGGTAVGGPGAGAVAALGVAGNRLMRTIASALTSKAKPEVIQKAADILTMTGGNRDQAIQMIRQVSQNMPQGASKAAMAALMNAILVTRPLPAPEAR